MTRIESTYYNQGSSCQQVDSTSQGCSNKDEEKSTPAISPKAAAAAKAEIVAGTGKQDTAASQPTRPPSDTSGNLQARWEAFVENELGLQPGSESCETLKGLYLSNRNNADFYDRLFSQVRNNKRPSLDLCCDPRFVELLKAIG